ncbi:MAG: DUF2163 domain-containing protein [Roseitalea sp.]|nr:DUF2163 domain-containing protein [Roseitalea sp.]MBO6720535.1 DUF2163 domain-containing protein [Roseitalea sp.]MBO6743682.1 DUF2163 domain-containing protein [Roseitalea sp.]
MRALHPDLQTHLESGATTVCLAWIVRRADGAMLGFTDHDRQLTIADTICEPQTGLTAGVAEASLGLGGDITDVSGVLSSSAISETDIERGAYDGADVALYLVNWQAPDTASLLRRFHVGEITREGQAFRVELRSLSAALDQPRGRFFTRHCDARLGDARCGFALSGTPGYGASGTVLGGDRARSIDLAGIGVHPDRWFDHGMLRFDGGVRAGEVLSVASASLSDASTMRLLMREPVGVSPATGDPVTLFAGCDKTFATCKAKFSNQLNFQGFPHMPGDDRALNYVYSDAVFDGGPLVP